MAYLAVHQFLLEACLIIKFFSGDRLVGLSMAELAEGSRILGVFPSLFRRQKTENSYNACC
jgi:hypothetical protein